MTQVTLPESAPSLEEILHRAMDRLIRLERSWIRENVGIGVSDFGVLRHLVRTDPVPVSVIGRKLLLTSGSVTTAVDRVERRGWVVRKSDPADRRGVMVSLTPAGRELVEAALPHYRAALDRMSAGLNPVEKAQLANLLRKWRKGMDPDPDRGPNRNPPGLRQAEIESIGGQTLVSGRDPS